MSYKPYKTPMTEALLNRPIQVHSVSHGVNTRDNRVWKANTLRECLDHIPVQYIIPNRQGEYFEMTENNTALITYPSVTQGLPREFIMVKFVE